MKNRKPSPEILVGLFIILGVLLLSGAILSLGGGRRFFTDFVVYHAHYRSVSGLIPGAKVMLSGVRAGSVVAVSFDPQTRDIRVDLEVEEELSRWVRADSEAQLVTQGMLGDRFVAITAGSPAAPTLAPGSPIRGVEKGDLGTFLTRGDEVLEAVTRITGSLDRMLQQLEREDRTQEVVRSLGRSATQLADLSEKLNRSVEREGLQKSLRALENILTKIDEGQGSLGAFINDPSLYDDTKAIVGEVNRNRIFRNIVRQAVRESLKAESRELQEPEARGGRIPPSRDRPEESR